MARICVDMDGVMADTYAKFVTAYEKEFNRVLTQKDLLGKKVYDLDGANHLRDLMYEKGFFRDLQVMDNAPEVLEELYAQHEIFIVTTATEFRHSMRDKWDWMAEHFPFIHHSRMVFCGTKDIVYGDYLLDDKVSNLKVFKGEGLLFSALDNHYDTGFHRLNNWLEVREFFRAERQSEISLLG
ncbi:5'(3')-deoxyribonucleotidase [Lewinella sp. 4G2]|uniref:5' nucleotidase, NT5C type n=1 Tax=Lewinella sp. 4G2 TaxID=1803372 RepID=UPI0007B4BD06|nr:5'(3')-deoxyribonucleotidase [Lewinella sp. 4G2]OAV45541.1 5'(3')-deoxyribonucleotidase [Lewinella sp. 4G2]